MKKKLLKILAISTLIVGVSAYLGHADVLSHDEIVALAADETVKGAFSTSTLSEDGKTRTWTPTATAKVGKGSTKTDCDVIFKGAKSKEIAISANKEFGLKLGTTIYVPVPAASSGQFKMVGSSDKSDRTCVLYVNNAASDRTLPMVSEGSVINFTENDFTKIGDKNYLQIQSQGDYKAASFSVILDVGSYYGVRYDVKYFDGETEYEDLSTKVNEGGLATRPNDPEKTGYNFVGWVNADDETFDFNTPITEDTFLYAKWESVSTFTLTVNLNYEGAPEATTTTVNANSQLVLPETPADRDGFDFAGWYLDAACETEATAGTLITENITLYAKWVAVNDFFVTFKVGDEVYATIKAIDGSPCKSWPSNPTPSLDSQEFVGWFDENGNEFKADSIPTADMIVTARFATKTRLEYKFADLLPQDAVSGQDVVLNSIVTIVGFNKTDTTAKTFDTTSYTSATQAKGVKFVLEENATVSFHVVQTSSQSRKIYFMNEEGRVFESSLQPASKKTGNTTQTINLTKGTYTTICSELTGQFNFYGMIIDFTNKDTITDQLSANKAFKLSNQKGHDANGNNIMRFVGEIDNALVENISSISVEVTATKKKLHTPVEGEENPGKYEVDSVTGNVLTEDTTENAVNVWTVYDRLTNSTEENAKYKPVNNRLYFEHIVTGLNEDYVALSCNATIVFLDGVTMQLTSTFDYVANFGA